MTTCDVMRCQKPGSERLTSDSNPAFERFICAEHKTAINGGAHWITDPDTHAVQMGADLPPTFKKLRRRRNEGTGQVFVIETDRATQDPLEILLTKEDRAALAKVLGF
jgi:hypothetical protein